MAFDPVTLALSILLGKNKLGGLDPATKEVLKKLSRAKVITAMGGSEDDFLTDAQRAQKAKIANRNAAAMERRKKIEDKRYIKKRGREGSIGAIPRTVGGVLAPTLATATQEAGNLTAAGANVLPAAMAAAGASQPQTKGAAELGMPNIGSIYGTTAGAVGDVDTALAQGTAKVLSTLLGATGNSILQRAAEKTAQQNNARLMRELPAISATPSQALVMSRLTSGNNIQTRSMLKGMYGN